MSAQSTNQNPTTAADMQPIVDAGRAEGLNRKALFLRYFRTARPEGKAVSETACDTADWKIGGIWFYAFDDLYACVITEDAEWEEVAGQAHESDASALAWLANQLRERCPVATMTTQEMINMAIDGTAEDAETILFQEAATRSLPRKESMTPDEIAADLADAALIRRQYAISEPEESA